MHPCQGSVLLHLNTILTSSKRCASMPIPSCIRSFIAAALLLSAVVCADDTTSRASDGSDKSTCEARTINHITHTLPQLCPTSSWTADFASGIARAQHTHNRTDAAVEAEATTSEPGKQRDEENGDEVAPPFMSFEDWKEMMLQKTGQDPQQLKGRKSGGSTDRVPPDENGAAWGDEGEIELDFAEYASVSEEPHNDARKNRTEAVEEAVSYDEVEGSVFRSKDAGKTCKERFSYSSFDAGATILKTGTATKNAKAILVENKDSYMLLECGRENKFVIIELSDDILLDTIVIANFEFFSSMIHRFRLSVSDRYPVKAEKWKELGIFEARNSRDIQAFLVENPQIWAKYVRLEFLTHYGKEYYCPVSLVRVHGSRMLDSWKEGGGREDDTAEEEQLETLPSRDFAQHDEPEATDVQVERAGRSSSAVLDSAQCLKEMYPASILFDIYTCPAMAPSVNDTITTQMLMSEAVETSPYTSTTSERYISAHVSVTTSSRTAHTAQHDSTVMSTITNLPDDTTMSKPEHSLSDVTAIPTSDEVAKFNSHPSADIQGNNLPPSGIDTTPSSLQGANSMSAQDSKASSHHSARTSTPPTGKASSQQGIKSSAPQGGRPPAQQVVKPSSQGSKTAPSSGTKVRGSGTGSASSASPTVQEGFFHSVMKRLQQVETNLTLSMQYIEDQSVHVQEAMLQIEKRQSHKIGLSLENLNSTVLNELRKIRDQYEQLWHSTVVGLESQREQSERDVVALSTRLNLLADEVVFQKRMAIAQAILLLSCLVLVIFSRGVTLPYLGPQSLQQGSTAFRTRPSSSASYTSLVTESRPISSTRQMTPESLIDLNFAGLSCGEPRTTQQSNSDLIMAEPPENCYRSAAPPAAETHRADEFMPSDEDLEKDVKRSPSFPGSHQHQTRKPLPALPEDPSSP